MAIQKSQSNEEKLEYLRLVLKENTKDNNKFPVYYSIYLIRFGNKVPVIIRAAAGNNITEEIRKYSSITFNPDYIVVDLYTGKSRRVSKPFATFKFDYKKR